MSERDPKDELAEIAGSLKRYLERQDAAGMGDLLASGARAAARAGRGPSQPAAGQRSQPAPAAPLERSTLAGGAAPQPHTSAAAGAAPGVSEAWAEAVAITHRAEEQDLFVGPESQTRSAGRVGGALAPGAIALHPAGLEARTTIHSASLPLVAQVAGEVNGCTLCGLCDTRTKAVPGSGSARSGIVFVGEAPGAEEDRQGKPFVGRAGDLLTKIIMAMDEKQLIPGMRLDRDSVFICNVLKCRPPENRNPLPHEIETCSPYLRRQLDALQPRIICCLGKFAAELLVGVKGTIAGLRGKTYRYQGAKLIVTYHPAACLRNPNYKAPVWEDMQRLAREYLSD